MHLHKTAANAATNAPTDKPAQSAKSAQIAKTSAPSFPALPRSVSSVIASAGLPADKLSASIVSFARFFSLPIKPELMASIRRQALAQPQSAAVQSDLVMQTTAESASDLGTAVKSKEALSLAAAAAESKGVELNQKGLEMYVEAIDPDQGRQDSKGQNQRGRRNRNQNENKEEGASLKTISLSASGVEEMALESAGKDPLLCVLNRMPGKNGQRWIVLPFKFSENGREFRVSMRILLETKNATDRAVCMALDIAESQDIESSFSEKRWLFMLESANSRISRLSVYLQPELLPKARSLFISELSALLEIPHECISVKKWEHFPCESGGADQLRSIDEAV